jgi:hypothetical protein
MVIEQNRHLVAVLDSIEVTRDIEAVCLRENEIEEAEAISNHRRRAEWIAGRIAAKYAFLSGEQAKGSSGVTALCISRLNGANFADFGFDAYQEVSVVKNQAPGGGPAFVGWSACGRALRVAISHSNGISCASVGASRVRSLDLEIPAPRIPEFYRHTFTNKERDWVGVCSRSHGLDPEWLFTLLWCTRECLLKIPRFSSLSLVNMPILEIIIPDGIERLTTICRSKELSEGFEFLQACTSHGRFQVAVAGAHNLVLTAITGVDNELDHAA